MFESSVYKCNGQIAEQGTTTIYRGIHNPSHEEVAIKVPHPGCHQTVVEAEILSQLHHEAIIQLKDVIRTENGPALVLPFASQSDLYAAMIANSGIPESDAKSVAFILLKALENIHAHRICHCDIKPENVLIMSNDFQNAVLCDFGCAIHIDCPRLGMIEGTDNYTAPEIWNFERYSEKADMWSMGVTLFEALTCSILFNVGESNDPSQCIRDGYRGLSSRSTFQSLSSDCRDLLKLLLYPDPAGRLTASSALAHPWFRDMAAETVCPQSFSVNPTVPFDRFASFTRSPISVY
jgi:serine/threonine protein kinase